MGRRKTPQITFMTRMLRVNYLPWSRSLWANLWLVATVIVMMAGKLGAQGAPGTGTVSAAVGSVYRISPNDLIHIKVYQEDDLETKLRISADGSATFPLLGTVQLGGKSVDEATALIRRELARDFLVNPQVNLVVLEYSKKRFTVLGHVFRPGSYEIPSEETVFFPQAIALAGGFTRMARKSKVQVTRQIGGTQTTITIDANSKGPSGNPQTFQILPGDTITVDESII